MLKKILFGILALLVIGGIYVFTRPPASPPDEVKFNQGGLEVGVTYSRPYKKGRLIFGEESDGALQPYGKYWRLGANAATELSVNKDFTLAGDPLKAGTYRMYAIPGTDTWELVLNSEAGVFLAFREPDYSKDVLKIKLTPQTQSPEVEQLTIALDGSDAGVDMNIMWDNIKLQVPIAAQ